MKNMKRLKIEEAVITGLWIVGVQVILLGELKTNSYLRTMKKAVFLLVMATKDSLLKLDRIRNNLNEAIDDVYFVDAFKFILLSVGQIFDKGNEVKFKSEK